MLGREHYAVCIPNRGAKRNEYLRHDLLVTKNPAPDEVVVHFDDTAKYLIEKWWGVLCNILIARLMPLQGKAGPLPRPLSNRRRSHQQVCYSTHACGFVARAQQRRSCVYGSRFLHAVPWGAQTREKTPEQEDAP